jgi:hypothetical protein
LALARCGLNFKVMDEAHSQARSKERYGIELNLEHGPNAGSALEMEVSKADWSGRRHGRS